MKVVFSDILIKSLEKAKKYDANVVTAPEVILWPDSLRQWTSIIRVIQEKISDVFVLGDYNPEINQGPAIWLKCVIGNKLEEVKVSDKPIPIIYLPGISLADLKNFQNPKPELSPLMEYQYTGTIWNHPNGKEWTVTAFMVNKEEGLGLNLTQDNTTKETALKVYPRFFEKVELDQQAHIDTNFLNSLIFPNEAQSVLNWLCKKDEFINNLSEEDRIVFHNICKNSYSFEADARNINSIAEELGNRKGNWSKVWEIYSSNPKNYPEIEGLLREKTPTDFQNGGLFEIPKDSWPKYNEEQEMLLKKDLDSIVHKSFNEAKNLIIDLHNKHSDRINWVWSKLGYSIYANSIIYLKQIVEITQEVIPTNTFKDFEEYYLNTGYKADYAMRKSYEVCTNTHSRDTIKKVLKVIYFGWLQKLAEKFQTLASKNVQIFNPINQIAEDDNFVLFVDAFRYELAKDFSKLFEKRYNIQFNHHYSSIPSVTPTAKPSISPILHEMNFDSQINEFRPQLSNNKDLLPSTFENTIAANGFTVIKTVLNIEKGKKIWIEIGKIDSTGHEEQSGIVYRISELFEQINEVIDNAFLFGYNKIKVVTDHGWLLMPGGLPKEELKKDYIEYRWGRCAIIKDTVDNNYLHLPWTWNKNVLIAYAPDISFFKNNEEYAHGGLSLQECLVPILTIENPNPAKEVSISLIEKWVNLKCSIEVNGADEDYSIVIRTNYSKKETDISKTKIIGNEKKITLFVENDDYISQAAFIVVLDSKEKIVYRKNTVVGE